MIFIKDIGVPEEIRTLVVAVKAGIGGICKICLD
jgi:hypothetical protein